MVGAARLADTLFVGFAIQPEWDVATPLHADGIDVKVVMSRQFKQQPAYQRIVERVRRIVQEELAVPHILGFHDRLLEVTPGPGYAFDPETRRIVTNPIRLAASVATRTSSTVEQGTGTLSRPGQLDQSPR